MVPNDTGPAIEESSIELAIQDATGPEWSMHIPAEAMLRRWVASALAGHIDDCQLTLRIVEAEEMSRLNETYRHRPGPTNVLSFGCECGELLVPPLLGDIVICAERVVGEASEQGKPVSDHWAHLVIHGCLHLLGHDHEDAAEAAIMEAREVECLDRLGIPDPYRPTTESVAPAAHGR